MRDKIVRRRLADGTVREYRYERGGDAPRTVGALLTEYKASPNFRGLAPSTKEHYLRSMEKIGEMHNVAIEAIKRRHILAQRDDLADTPAQANKLVQVWSILMRFAVEREYRTDNPAYSIKKLGIGEYSRWTEAAVSFALKTLPEHLRRALALLRGEAPKAVVHRGRAPLHDIAAERRAARRCAVAVVVH